MIAEIVWHCIRAAKNALNFAKKQFAPRHNVFGDRPLPFEKIWLGEFNASPSITVLVVSVRFDVGLCRYARFAARAHRESGGWPYSPSGLYQQPRDDRRDVRPGQPSRPADYP